jgi:hypothetical protein
VAEEKEAEGVVTGPPGSVMVIGKTQVMKTLDSHDIIFIILIRSDHRLFVRAY